MLRETKEGNGCLLEINPLRLRLVLQGMNRQAYMSMNAQVNGKLLAQQL